MTDADSTVRLGDVEFDPLEINDFRLSIEGNSGTGKSNTLAVILEDLADVPIPTLIIERIGTLTTARLEDDDIIVVGARQEEGIDLAVGLQDLEQELQDLRRENERLRSSSEEFDLGELDEYEDFLEEPDVREAFEEAKVEDYPSPKYHKGVIAAIVEERGPVSYEEIQERLGVSRTNEISSAATTLEGYKIVEKEKRDGSTYVDLNVDGIREIRESAAKRRKTEELMEQF